MIIMSNNFSLFPIPLTAIIDITTELSIGRKVCGPGILITGLGPYLPKLT